MLIHISTSSYQVRQLEKKLSSQGQPCHIIWSSSQASLGVEIDLNDIQDVAGLVTLCMRTRACVTLLWLAVARRDPYAVSKKTMELAAIQLNKELSEKASNILIFTNI